MLDAYYDRIDPATIAPVSRDTPLLSNLDIIENIALIREVHGAQSRKQAQAAALNVLKSLEYAHTAYRRPSACDAKERFVAQLVRASMMQNVKIVLVNPFVMLNDSEPLMWIADLLFHLDREAEALILDVSINRNKYEAGGERCTILV